eukprot:1141948-Pelagomonas_calceolata.AAC.4
MAYRHSGPTATVLGTERCTFELNPIQPSPSPPTSTMACRHSGPTATVLGTEALHPSAPCGGLWSVCNSISTSRGPRKAGRSTQCLCIPCTEKPQAAATQWLGLWMGSSTKRPSSKSLTTPSKTFYRKGGCVEQQTAHVLKWYNSMSIILKCQNSLAMMGPVGMRHWPCRYEALAL